jgi:hypothetical protein
MSEFSQIIRDLPVSGVIPVFLLVVLGLLLWAAGRRMLRFAVAAAGLVCGSLLGLLAGEATGMAYAAWIGSVIGALAMAGAALLAFRAAVAMIMAVVFAIASPLCVIAIAEIQAKRAGVSVRDGEIHNPITDKATQWWDRVEQTEAGEQTRLAIKSATDATKKKLDASLQRARDALSESVGTQVADQLAEVQRFTARLVAAIKSQWDQAPESMRPTLIFAALLGAVVGLFVGFFAHSFSAAAVTACAGSLLWLGAARVLAVRLGIPEGPWMPASGTAWLSVWLITALLGLGIQWSFRRRKVTSADKA